jgi:CBS domain-containing protein
MTAGEYCNREVIISGQNASVTEAAMLMRQHHVGDLVVVKKQGEKTLPIGIITDRDIVIEVIAQKADPDSLIIKDIMSTDLITVKEKDALLDTLELMQNQGVRRVVVVDGQGSLQGLLSADDAIELIAEAMNSLTKLAKREITREEKEHS